MKKNFKTITISVELSSEDNLEKITSKMIKKLSKCATKVVNSKNINLDSINVHQFPLNIN
jgi:tetrahydrodipicolinate N-succinyltransferase